MSLINDVRRTVENECRGLDPDGDVLPALLYCDARDHRTMLGLATDETDADAMAMYMTASLIVDEAVQAFYSSFVWSVTETRPEVVERTRENLRWRGPMPREHPDRVEQAMIAHYTPDGASIHFAPVIRSAYAAPALGDWHEDDTFTKLGGRIPRSLERGLKMVATVPEELRVVFRMACQAGNEAREGAIRGVIGSMTGRRP